MRLIIFFLLISSSCFCQSIPKSPQIDLIIRCIDDSIVFQLTNQSNKDIYYSQSSPFLPAQKVKTGNIYYLQLEMESNYFYIYPEGTLLVGIEQPADILRAQTSITYKRNLKKMFPFTFRKGQYKILVAVEYFYNKKRFEAESNFLDFSMP